MQANETTEYFDEDAVVESKVQQLAAFVRAAKRLTVFTGAGISTSAGIPDFRGPKGVWTLKAEGKIIDRNFDMDVSPTLAHRALVALQKTSSIRATIVSTNTDGMHLRSGVDLENFAEIHGNKNIEACACGKVFYRGFSVMPKWIPYNNSLLTGRRCDCGLPLRLTNVAFGQSMPDLALEKAEMLAARSDLSLVLGTSMRVQPAASLVRAGQANSGFRLVVVNLQKTTEDDHTTLRIFARTDRVMELLMRALEIDIPEYRDLSLPTNDAWITQFQSAYKFRSPKQEWFQGPADRTRSSSPLEEKEERERLAAVRSSPLDRRWARVRQDFQGEHGFNLKAGELVDVIKEISKKQVLCVVVDCCAREIRQGITPTRVLESYPEEVKPPTANWWSIF